MCCCCCSYCYQIQIHFAWFRFITKVHWHFLFVFFNHKVVTVQCTLAIYVFVQWTFMFFIFHIQTNIIRFTQTRTHADSRSILDWTWGNYMLIQDAQWWEKYTISSHLSVFVSFHFAHLFRVAIIVIGSFVLSCLSYVSLLVCSKDVSHLLTHSSSFVPFRVAHFSYFFVISLRFRAGNSISFSFK